MKKVDWNEIVYMVFVLLIIAMLLFSCTTSRCGNWKDVQRHDRKPFRASINSDLYERSVLVSVRRTQTGFKHLFISDNGDTIVKTLRVRLCKDSCYLVPKEWKI
jgi:hypothetical protein